MEGSSPAIRPPGSELAQLEARAWLGLTLGVLSALIGWLCTLPIGVFALFLAIQTEAGVLRLEESIELPADLFQRLASLRRRARWALALGGVGTALFLASLARFLWLYLVAS
ncbi:MAG: hypothetical protein CFK52_10095 [Chloracidobacterium sp. CP2_5A]|nr:MAG: hypothetical protein CFK52_10095 [Chloracidobacterium sp. CP2_5A]